MATNKPRFPITIEPEIAEIIENYRHQHKIKSTSKAAVELLTKGIEGFHQQTAIEEGKKNKAPTADEAAEALYVLLYYHLGEPPTEKQISAFSSMLSTLCNGLRGQK